MRVIAQDSKTRRSNRPSGALLASLFFFLPFAISAESYEEALALEQAGDLEAAKKAYAGLLQAGDKDYCAIVSRLAGLTSNLEEKRALLVKGLEECNDTQMRHDMYVTLADIEEITGNLVTAQRYYQSASLAVPGKKDFQSLLSSAMLLFETGNYRGAEAQATVIMETCTVERIVQDAKVLLSRVYFASEREQKALQVATGLMNDKNESLDTAALLWIAELAAFMDKPELSAKAADLLLSEYPESPEAQVFTGTVRRLPSFSVFIGRRQETVSGPSVQSTPASEPVEAEKVAVLSVQTGSYSIRENAEYALKDLQAEGFSAEIRERAVGETVYHRVLIPDIEADEVERVILELKEKGFEGFRVYE
ncbi:MAG: SPOR domain-containing protein [Spirochaetales bacterium]|nr:SPOR domain-containing protein [Spirochaetales bacterium]